MADVYQSKLQEMERATERRKAYDEGIVYYWAEMDQIDQDMEWGTAYDEDHYTRQRNELWRFLQKHCEKYPEFAK